MGDIVLDGNYRRYYLGCLCPEFKHYYYSIGLRMKQELYVISQAIRCKLDVTLLPNMRRVTPAYFKATIPMLCNRAAMLLRNTVEVDETSTSYLPTQPAPLISAPPLVQPQ